LGPLPPKTLDVHEVRWSSAHDGGSRSDLVTLYLLNMAGYVVLEVCVCVKLASAMQPILLKGDSGRKLCVCAKLASAMQPISATEGRIRQSVAWSQGY